MGKVNKNFYDMLNDGDFSAPEIDDIERENFNDIEKKKIINKIRKNKKDKYFGSKLIKIATVIGLMISISLIVPFSRNIVLAKVNEIVTYIDPSKNYYNDYIASLDKEVVTDGVKIKLDEFYRGDGDIRLAYTLTFNEKVPDSVKAKGSLKNSIYAFDFEGKPIYKESMSYENGGFSSEEVYINNKELIDLYNDKEYVRELGILYCISRDISITDKSIQKEFIIYGVGEKIKHDLNIVIKYKDIKLGLFNKLKGNFNVEYTVKAEEKVEPVKKEKLEQECNLDDGSKISLGSYSNTNTGLKIYGEDSEWSAERGCVRLQGYDNLGNLMIMYPHSTSTATSGKSDCIFEVYDGVADTMIDRKTLGKDVTEVKLRMYQDVSTWDGAAWHFKWVPVCDEFTINLNK